MVQILQPVPSAKTMRQQAFQQGIDQIGQGLAGFAGAYDQQTQRQQALQGEILKTTAALRESGFDVTPDQVAAQLAPKESGGMFSKFFGGGNKQSQAPKGDIFANKTAEKLQREQDAEIERSLKLAQLAELGKPFEQSREGKKLITSENIRAQADLRKQQAEMEMNPLGKLGGEDKNKVGSIATGLQSLENMKTAINEGYKPQYVDSDTPILGMFKSDDPFTKEKRIISEVIGRLQSGGAIGKEEEKRFNAMGPRPGDEPEIAAQKIEDQKRFLNNKLKAYNLNEQKLRNAGFDIPASSPVMPQPQIDPSIQAKQQRLMELRAKAGIR